jgi:hypothetical protein
VASRPGTIGKELGEKGSRHIMKATTSGLVEGQRIRWRVAGGGYLSVFNPWLLTVTLLAATLLVNFKDAKLQSIRIVI